MGRLLGLAPGDVLLWECHDCHEGVVIPAPYVDHHGHRVQIDPERIDPETPVYRF